MVKLFVIPGHGAGDPGAGGYGYTEAERVRALATAIKRWGGDNVMLADFSRNYYADGGINRLTIPKDYKIVELHMDAASASARGGHVIIQAGTGGPDVYDKALGSLMLKYFPGRANLIVERNDLANPARAAAKGYNYRLVENGFITNAGDLDTFNRNIDAIAKGYLSAFGIPIVEEIDVEEIKKILNSIKSLVGDTKDYSGRGKDGATIFYRIPWMAAKQEAMQKDITAIKGKLNTMDKKLDTIVASLKK